MLIPFHFISLFHFIIPYSISFHFITIHNCYETIIILFYYLQRFSGRSEGGLSGHTTSAILGLLKHVLCVCVASRLNASLLNARLLAATLGRLRLRLRLRLGLLIRLLGTLQDLLERHIAVDLHSSLHMSEPRVLTRTVAASFATTSGLVIGAIAEFGFGGGGGHFFVGFDYGVEFGHLKLNES
jgi:hypothetical protein